MLHIGKVEIKKLIAGEQRLLNTVGKGSLLGELALFRDAPRSATAIATEAVTLMVIPGNRLDHMVRSNPALAAALIKDLANRMLRAEDVARDAEKRSAEAEARARDAEQPHRNRSRAAASRATPPHSAVRHSLPRTANAPAGEKGPDARRRPKAGREA